MDYEEFKETLRSLVNDGLGEDIAVSVSNISKNNGRMREAMVIKKKGSEISPSIYLEIFWKLYKKGEVIEELASLIIRVYKESEVTDRLDLNIFLDFEKVKERIVYKVINREKNKELLKEVPHVDFLDLAVIFCYMFAEGELEGATIMIRNSHLEYWEINVSDLAECAAENTQRILGYRIRNILDYLKKIYSLEELSAEGLVDDTYAPMYVLSNKTGLYGAGCILYKGLLKSLSERLDSDFYVFPSSVHEVILMPDNDKSGAAYYQKLVQEINSTEIAAEEVLSDSVYYYSRGEDRLRQLA